MYDKVNLKNINERLSRPTSPFFKKLYRGFGTLAAAGSAILGLASLPVALPALLVTASTYMFAIGISGAMVCKLTIDPEKTYEALINKKHNTNEN